MANALDNLVDSASSPSGGNALDRLVNGTHAIAKPKGSSAPVAKPQKPGARLSGDATRWVTAQARNNPGHNAEWVYENVVKARHPGYDKDQAMGLLDRSIVLSGQLKEERLQGNHPYMSHPVENIWQPLAEIGKSIYSGAIEPVITFPARTWSTLVNPADLDGPDKANANAARIGEGYKNLVEKIPYVGKTDIPKMVGHTIEEGARPFTGEEAVDFPGQIADTALHAAKLYKQGNVEPLVGLLAMAVGGIHGAHGMIEDASEGRSMRAGEEYSQQPEVSAEFARRMADKHARTPSEEASLRVARRKSAVPAPWKNDANLRKSFNDVMEAFDKDDAFKGLSEEEKIAVRASVAKRIGAPKKIAPKETPWSELLTEANRVKETASKPTAPDSSSGGTPESGDTYNLDAIGKVTVHEVKGNSIAVIAENGAKFKMPLDKFQSMIAKPAEEAPAPPEAPAPSFAAPLDVQGNAPHTEYPTNAPETTDPWPNVGYTPGRNVPWAPIEDALQRRLDLSNLEDAQVIQDFKDGNGQKYIDAINGGRTNAPQDAPMPTDGTTTAPEAVNPPAPQPQPVVANPLVQPQSLVAQDESTLFDQPAAEPKSAESVAKETVEKDMAEQEKKQAAQKQNDEDARNTVQMSPENLRVHPTMQFKKKGITDHVNNVDSSMKGLKDYNTDLGGTLSGWLPDVSEPGQDPYIAHGHHRAELGKRAKRFVAFDKDNHTVEVPRKLSVRIFKESEGYTLNSMRNRSALENIADNTGSAIDAAAVMKDLGTTRTELATVYGIRPQSRLYQDIKGLMNLSDSSLERVKSGDVNESVAAGIGDVITDPTLQKVAIDAAQRGNLERYGDGVLLANNIRAEDVVRRNEGAQGAMFGDGDDSGFVSTLGEQTQIQSGIIKDLKGSRSNLLKAVDMRLIEGENIDAEARKEQAGEIGPSGSAIEKKMGLVFTEDREVKDAIREAAGRVAKGEQSVKDAINDTIGLAVERAKQSLATIGKGKGNVVEGSTRWDGKEPSQRVDKPVVVSFVNTPAGKQGTSSLLESPDDFKLVGDKAKAEQKPEPPEQSGPGLFEDDQVTGKGSKQNGMSAIIDTTQKQGVRHGRLDGDAEIEAQSPVTIADNSIKATERVVNLFQNFWKGIKKIGSTDKVDADAETTGRVIREIGGKNARQNDIAWQESEDRRNSWNEASNDESKDFIRSIENNEERSDPAMEKVRQLYKTRLERTWQKMARIKNHVGYIEDYFPHLWKDPKKAQDFFKELSAKRPLEGSKGFLKARTHMTFQDGLDAGLEPITWNPEELVLLHEMQVMKFCMAHDILGKLKSLGLVKYIRVGVSVEPGWAKINDAIGTVYGNPNIPVREGFDAVMSTKLDNLISSLKVKSGRETNIGGGGNLWGWAKGDKEIMTKFGGPESVKTHELGHILDSRYGLADEIFDTKTGRGRSGVDAEVRALADLRYEGIDPSKVSDSFKKYVRKSSEKMANLVHAYVHAPELMEEVAPMASAKFKAFIAEHPELSALEKIKPSLVLGSNTGSVNAGGLIIRGSYYMPENAARVVNNYLSPGLMGNGAFKAARYIGNNMNMVQLGISAFHAGFTTADVIISHVSTGWADVLDGHPVKGAVGIAKGLSPFTPIKNIITGVKIRREWRTPGRYPELSGVTDLAAQAGARATTGDMYFGSGDGVGHRSAARMLRDAYKSGDKAGVMANVMPAIFEAVAAPTMQHLVPVQKLGIFQHLVEHELSRFPDATAEEKTQIAQRTWDSVDNRMGQLVYDNLFWNKTLRDSAMVAVRSVGWNTGTIRELGGAVQDTLSLPSRVKASGKWGGAFTQKQTYAISLITTTALANAVTTYLATGEKPHGMDYFAARWDKQGHRIVPPTYMKDILSARYNGVQKTIAGKLHPLLTEAIEQWTNSDWKGDPIRYGDDPASKQVMESVDHFIGQFKPLSISKAEDKNTPMPAKIAGFFGFTAAPKYLTDSDAMQMAHRYQTAKAKASTQEDAQRTDLAGQLASQAQLNFKRTGDISTAVEPARDAARAGKITNAEFANIVKGAREDPLLRAITHLQADQGLKVYEVSTPAERKTIGQTVWSKIVRSKLPTEKKRVLANQFKQLSEGRK
jgi:hypothetical protein